jgi:luciferase family oxidoreductase group 1
MPAAFATLFLSFVMPQFSLGALELSPVFPGMTVVAALREMVDLAPLLEGFGYSRFWIAEHHHASIAHACPEILVPVVAGLTERIRVGSGGVLLRQYSPRKVAESFRLLQALFPGRIDLGIARGGVGQTPQARIEFEQAVADLLDYLRDGKEESASPVGVAVPEVWLLGSNVTSMEVAARLGTAFSFALFLAGPETDVCEVIRRYREQYQPSPEHPAPRCSIAVAGVCAKTDEIARQLAQLAVPYSVVPTLVGKPENCARQLGELCARTGVRDFVFLDMSRPFEARLESYRLLAEALLQPSQR